MTNTNTASNVFPLFDIDSETAAKIRKAKSSEIESSILAAFCDTPAGELRTATMRAALRLHAEAGRELADKRMCEAAKDKDGAAKAATRMHARLTLSKACYALHDKVCGVRVWQSAEPFRAETRRMISVRGAAAANASAMASAMKPVINEAIESVADLIEAPMHALVMAGAARDAEIAELRKITQALAAAFDTAITTAAPGTVVENHPAPGVIEEAAKASVKNDETPATA